MNGGALMRLPSEASEHKPDGTWQRTYGENSASSGFPHYEVGARQQALSYWLKYDTPATPLLIGIRQFAL
jgi:hypothetical protein